MKTLDLRKSIMRHIIRLPSLAAIIALHFTVMGSVQTVHSATITVINTNDSGAGSLRQALADASDGDTIDFSVTTPATITLISGELLVDKSVTIGGPGADQLSVNGNAASRVFHIAPDKTVTISGLNIRNGLASGFYPDNAGGGICNDHGTLTINNTTLNGNSARQGGGIFNNGDVGSATVAINNSTLSDNSATGGGGGGIYNYSQLDGSATVTINNSTLSDNSATGAGGGIENFTYLDGSTTITINNTTLIGNAAPDGGGIYTLGLGSATVVTINNSTLSDNSATHFGGGIWAVDAGSAILTIKDSTLSGNSAGYYGGGISYRADAGSATLTINHSTLNGNSAGLYYGSSIHHGSSGGIATLTISNTILKTGALGENFFVENPSTFTSLGYNLSSDAAGGNATTGPGGLLNQTGDIRNTDPMLGPLQDNGGPTFTHELLSGSPAIDAGDPNFTPPPDYDQRGPGFDRVVNDRIDIGAFEAAAPPYGAQVQQPIDSDGSSVFNVKRGIVPVKFTLTLDGVATCDLPPATIVVTRTAGGTTGQIDESVYSGPADTGSNFRIDSCQYAYNLSASALGKGTYQVDIKINDQTVGSAIFQLK
jgi:hypothetical protein